MLGGGTMGAGIAQVLLRALERGTVTIVERDDQAADAAVRRVTLGLERQHARDEDPPARVRAALARLETAVSFGPPVSADLVIEAVYEDLATKKGVLAAARSAWPDALLATNTSSLSVTELAGSLISSDRFIGMHFFHPVPLSTLVEIVRPDGCSAATVDEALEWVALIGREPIVVRDSPGFATSRLGVSLGLEAIRMVAEGVASVHDIDRGMVLGYKFPIGPLELTDRVGLDVRLAIAEHLAKVLGDRFEPPALLRDKVAAGELGQKSGKGFYDWTQRS